MTLILIFGLFTGLYLLWLMVRLATFALPLYAGIGVGLWFLHHSHGFLAAILAGSFVGVVTLVAGQLVFDYVRSPALRSGIALLFVVPAGFAGYQVVQGLARLVISNGVLLTALGAIGGGFIARSAWLQLTTPPWSTPNGRLPRDSDRPSPGSTRGLTAPSQNNAEPCDQRGNRQRTNQHRLDLHRRWPSH